LKDGSNYTGDFKDGYRSGQGTMVFSDGNKYIGAWFNDKQHGIGIFNNVQESWKKQGEWRDGRRIRWLDNPIRLNGSSS
jgi:hypothetical protein